MHVQSGDGQVIRVCHFIGLRKLLPPDAVLGSGASGGHLLIMASTEPWIDSQGALSAGSGGELRDHTESADVHTNFMFFDHFQGSPVENIGRQFDVFNRESGMDRLENLRARDCIDVSVLFGEPFQQV